MMIRISRNLLLLGCVGLMGALAHAQDYPTKPLRLIVPFAPGGGNDALARIVSAKLGAALGQQVVVENRAGANGAVGTEFVTKAAPDGYTLLLGFVGPLAVLPHMGKMGYEPLSQLAPVGMIANAYQVLAVHPSVPAKNVAELVALAKAQPGKLAYASGGAGTPLHLVPELFKLAAGVDLLNVPYKGSSPAALSVLAGDTQVIFGAMFSTLPQVKAATCARWLLPAPSAWPPRPSCLRWPSLATPASRPARGTGFSCLQARRPPSSPASIARSGKSQAGASIGTCSISKGLIRSRARRKRFARSS
jgi:tripartite-type tricarboxylate transporter receptor subunit TctC